MARSPERAIFFVDGANIYKGLEEIGVQAAWLDLPELCKALAGPRECVEIRYYIGKVRREGRPDLASKQQSFLARLRRQRVTIHLGRVEARNRPNPLAKAVMDFLDSNRIPAPAARTLRDLAASHENVKYWIEKAVDTYLATDLVRIASDDEFDVAYLLSGDGDFTPCVEHVRTLGKRVFGVSPRDHNYQLSQACDVFITKPRDWWHGFELPRV